MFHFKLDKSGELIEPADMQWWDGTSDGKTAATDGVYFVKYIARGLSGKIIKDQTFFHLEGRK